MSRNTHNTQSNTCTVPLFLSTAHARREASREQLHHRSDARSRSSTHSLIDANARPISPIQPLRPAVYQPHHNQQSLPPRSEHSDLYGPGQTPSHSRRKPSISDLESGDLSHSKPMSTSRTHRPRKKITRSQQLRSHIHNKRRLTISFAITLVIASIIYLSLAVSHTLGGTVFHVLSILLLLSLLGVFAHSLVRWVMLKRDYDVHAERRLKRTQPPSFRGWDISWPQPLHNQPPPEPIPVYMHGDQETLSQLSEPHPNEDAGPDPFIVQPPPIYGNFRDSVRINPSHISIQAVPLDPSLHTPSYAAAVSQPMNPNPAHMAGGLGYRLPSYGSEGGITQVLENRRREVENRLKGMSPGNGASKRRGRSGARGARRVVRGRQGERGMWIREKKG